MRANKEMEPTAQKSAPRLTSRPFGGSVCSSRELQGHLLSQAPPGRDVLRKRTFAGRDCSAIRESRRKASIADGACTLDPVRHYRRRFRARSHWIRRSGRYRAPTGRAISQPVRTYSTSALHGASLSFGHWNSDSDLLAGDVVFAGVRGLWMAHRRIKRSVAPHAVAMAPTVRRNGEAVAYPISEGLCSWCVRAWGIHPVWRVSIHVLVVASHRNAAELAVAPEPAQRMLVVPLLGSRRPGEPDR